MSCEPSNKVAIPDTHPHPPADATNSVIVLEYRPPIRAAHGIPTGEWANHTRATGIVAPTAETALFLFRSGHPYRQIERVKDCGPSSETSLEAAVQACRDAWGTEPPWPQETEAAEQTRQVQLPGFE